jgi:hypothetical protein
MSEGSEHIAPDHPEVSSTPNTSSVPTTTCLPLPSSSSSTTTTTTTTTAHDTFTIAATPTERRRRRRRQRNPNARFIAQKFSRSVLSVMIPVGICMLLVVFSFKILETNQEKNSQMALPYNEKKSDDSSDKFWGSLLNAIFIIVVFFIIAILMVILYKCKCYKVIFGYIALAVFLLFFVVGFQWL